MGKMNISNIIAHQKFSCFAHTCIEQTMINPMAKVEATAATSFSLFIPTRV